MSDELAKIIPGEADADAGLSVLELAYANAYADHLAVGAREPAADLLDRDRAIMIRQVLDREWGRKVWHHRRRRKRKKT